ncbi:MAG: ATP-binding cassette domain-containing protein [Alcanivoracaceae bacterium]|jgi:phospholipid/cholesterol/gamma-HCH transport system ATP-binding protein|nr:ATP-binding cassette domain-containing protein [Alcanivoracaceae bacterium]
MTDNLIEIRDVSLRRGDRTLFSGINLDIPRGSVTAIMGPSGCGKTTLLRLIGGQLKASSGQVLVDGQEVSRLGRNDLFRLRRRMGMLFQAGALFTDLSVYDNVAFPLRMHTRLPESMIRDLVLMKLDAVGLRGARDLMPAELSGGMARRAALARAIILDPDLIIYDEPFAGQDPISMGMLATLIARLNKALAITTIIVSHDVTETAAIADYMHVIADGKIRGQGPTQTVMNSSDARVRQFIQGLPDGPVPFQYPAVDYYQDLGLESGQ